MKPHEQFVQEVFDLVKNEYIVESKYNSALVYIQMKHNVCGNEYPVTPAHFLTGNRCPICYESKNGYNFLEIWYRDYNRIEEILLNCLKELSKKDNSFLLNKIKEKY